MRTYSKFSSIILGLVTLTLVLASGGCSSINYPLAPSQVPELEASYLYRIGPGDSVNIFVWGDPELSGSFPVRPDGMFTTRLIEDIPASGKTPTQLARELEEAFSTYVKGPVVTVIVNGFVGIPSQQVRVVGEATTPTSVPFRKHMTLLDLMIDVGGMTDFADGNNTVLIRYASGEEELYKVHLDDLLRDGDITANVNLMPGDILILTEAWF